MLSFAMEKICCLSTLVSPQDDIIVFITYAFLFIFAFGTAFVGLMPSLGDGPFHVNGAFFAPFWSMYGEFGDLIDVEIAGGSLTTRC